MRVEKTVWNSMKAIGGFVVGAVTVFGWLCVTPEMVGQVTYDIMRGPAPLAVMFVSGSLFGWGVTKLWSDHRMKEASEAHDAEIAGRPTQEDVDELRRQLAAKDAEIESLEAELERRPTIEEVDARVVEAIGVFVDATAAKFDELSKTSDDRLRERMSSGEVSGFSARVLGEVLALDAHPRRWLRAARDEGFVDVEDRDVDLDDRLGHFRNLVTAAETGLPGEWGYPMTRYVLNDGVRDVLESFPEVFELVDRDDDEIARIVSECGGKPYDPETAAYRRVSR